jgi:hypothetical protein
MLMKMLDDVLLCLEDFIVEYVRSAGRFVPFHVITTMASVRFDFDAEGDAQIVSPDNPNHVVWPFLNPMLADAIISAVRKKRIFLIPALAEQYTNIGIDFREQGFTVADYDNPPQGGSKPIWLPMTLSSQPLTVKPPPFMTEEEVAAYR